MEIRRIEWAQNGPEKKLLIRDMVTITNAGILKEVRAIAKRNGMTFKSTPTMHNGARLYKFVSRATGEILWENTTLQTAYSDAMSGYVDSRKQEAI